MENRKKIVVLGANSFSGQDFVDLLLNNPQYSVTGISRSPERSATFLKYKNKKNVADYQYFQCDMNNNMGDLLALLDEIKPEYIVNFAAQSEVGPSWQYPEDWYQTNCVALAKLINHLRNKKYLKKYLHISSPEVYGSCSGIVKEDAPFNPSTPYAASKAAADMLLFTYYKQFGFPLLMVRATNVYGARQQLYKIIPRTIVYLKLNKMIELHGGGQAVKSYIHIRDVSRGELAILEDGQIGSIYHLSPDQGTKVKDVVQIICNKMGYDFNEVATAVEERPGQDAAYIISSECARQSLGWVPQISIEDGLQETIDWVQENWDNISQQPLEYEHKL